MAPQIPEDFSSHIEKVGDYPVAITSYRLGTRYIAKVEIRVPGAEARIAFREDTSKASAEGGALADARWLIERTALRR